MIIKAGIIGCGRPGRGMARSHAKGYLAAGAELTAIADIAEENLASFRADCGGKRSYLDYQQMLAQEKLDIVSICTWPHLHAPMVIAAAEAGVRAIHCEKPMAPSWGEARRMEAVCRERGVQLTFNHQRRFGTPFRKARQLLRDGEIGRLQRLEGSTDNLFDWGTHWFDMFFFYNEETPAEWVLAQIEWRESRALFGVPLERQAVTEIGFANGVLGLMVTGQNHHAYGARNRLVGTEGIIEVGVLENEKETISLRILNATSNGWKTIETGGENLHGDRLVERAISDALDALKTGREPELAARKALQGTEIIFAAYESSRRRGRVSLPLETESSALLDILQENDAIPPGTTVTIRA